MANLGLLSFVATNEGPITHEDFGQTSLYQTKSESMTSTIYPNGDEVFCTKYNATKVGICKEYYSGVEKSSYTHINTHKNGIYIQMHEEAGPESETVKHIIECKNDMHHGEGKYFNQDGKLVSHGIYYNGYMEGPCGIYGPNGLKIKDVYYNKGVIYMINEFYPSGEIKDSYDIKNGKVHGSLMSFHLNGKVKTMVTYVNGKSHGLEKTYSEFGNLVSEINYYDGIRHGSCTYYESNGDITDIYLYHNGQPTVYY